MNQTILITGASRGIGKAIALKFSKPGNHLVITCQTNQTQLEEVATLIRSAGASCDTFLGNLGDSQVVTEGLFTMLHQKHLSPDLLINNAGISHVGLLQDMSAKEWHTVIDSNLSSVFFCCHDVIPMMLQKGHGRIINISSMWGTYGASCEVAYSASKGGLNAFTKALAKELAPSGIQVNAIACGVIDTEMNQHLSETERTVLADEIPVGRFAEPDEVADIVYLLSESGNFLTGQIIGFDGAMF